MKKHLLLILVFVSAFALKAQHWYVGITPGFGWGMQKNGISRSYASIDNTGYFKDYNASLGKGLYANLFIGRSIDKASFFEVGVKAWNISKVTSSYNSFSYGQDTTRHTGVGNMIISGQSLFAYLALGFNYSISEKIELRTKAGIMAGKPSIKSVTDITYTRTPAGPNAQTTTTHIEEVMEYKSAFNLGFTTSIEGRYRYNKHFGFGAELWAQVINARMESAKMTKYNENGEDKLDKKLPFEKDIKYYNGKANNTYTEKIPSASGTYESQSLTIPLSAWGFTIGAYYYF